eukprot:g20064.t1
MPFFENSCVVRAWIRLEPECGPPDATHLKVRRRESSSCFILYPLTHPHTSDAGLGSFPEKGGAASSPSPATGDWAPPHGRPRMVRGRRTRVRDGEFAEYVLDLPNEPNAWAWSVLDCDADAGAPVDEDHAGSKKSDSEDAVSSGEASGGSTQLDFSRMDPYNGALFRVYKDFGSLTVLPPQVPGGRSTALEIRPEHPLPRFLPAHREKIGVRFSSPRTGRSKMVDGQLNRGGDAIKVVSPGAWDGEERVEVEVFWCEIPKEWADTFRPHAAPGVLEILPEQSMFAAATRQLDERHLPETAPMLAAQQSAQLAYASARAAGGADDVFAGAKKADDYVDADGDHYVLSRKADFSIPTDSRFLRDLCVLILAASLGSLAVRLLHLDTALGCVLGGSLVGPGGYNLISEHVQVESVAEFGLVFLMFELGFTFSVKRIAKAWWAAVTGGVLVTLSLVFVFGVLALLRGTDVQEALLIGVFVSVSSTALVASSTSQNQNQSHLEDRDHASKVDVPDYAAASSDVEQGGQSDLNFNGALTSRPLGGRRNPGRARRGSLSSSSRGGGGGPDGACRRTSLGNSATSSSEGRSGSKNLMRRAGTGGMSLQSNALIAILVTQDLILALVLALFPVLFGVAGGGGHLSLSLPRVQLTTTKLVVLVFGASLVLLLVTTHGRKLRVLETWFPGAAFPSGGMRSSKFSTTNAPAMGGVGATANTASRTASPGAAGARAGNGGTAAHDLAPSTTPKKTSSSISCSDPHQRLPLQQLLLTAWCLFFVLTGEQLSLFSKEVGAFLAGVLLLPNWKLAAFDAMRPLKDFFMLIFFGYIGLMMRPLFLYDNLHSIFLVWVLLTVIKFVVTMVHLVACANQRTSIALYISLCLSHVGEFAFLILAKGKAWGALSNKVHLLLLGAATFSLVTSPLVLGAAQRWVRRVTSGGQRSRWQEEERELELTSFALAKTTTDRGGGDPGSNPGGGAASSCGYTLPGPGACKTVASMIREAAGAKISCTGTDRGARKAVGALDFGASDVEDDATEPGARGPSGGPRCSPRLPIYAERLPEAHQEAQQEAQQAGQMNTNASRVDELLRRCSAVSASTRRISSDLKEALEVARPSVEKVAKRVEVMAQLQEQIQRAEAELSNDPDAAAFGRSRQTDWANRFV